MKIYLLSALVCFTVIIQSLVAQTNGATPQAIPEEARRHFVIGTALFKDAKTAGDFVQVVSEFKQAVDLAPQWADARYDLGLAKEAAGDYSGAMADLKLYIQFKLSEAEARTVQDKIYEVEAKQAKANDPEAKGRERDALEIKNIRQAQLDHPLLIQKLVDTTFIGQSINGSESFKEKDRFRRNAESGLLECAVSILMIKSNSPIAPVTGQWTEEVVFPVGVDPSTETDFSGCGMMVHSRISDDGRAISSDSDAGVVVYRQ